METIYICILTLLGVFAMMLWLVFHFNRVQKDLEEGMHSVKQNLEGDRARIMQLDEAQKKERALVPVQTEGVKPSQKDVSLTVGGISEVVKAAGYTPEMGEDSIAFTKGGDQYLIDARRLPRIFIRKGYRVDPRELNLEAMKHAAYLMSDDIIMVKACLSDEPDEDGVVYLTFFLAVMDRTFRSFQENLTEYLEILDLGRQRFGEFYDQIEKEKAEASSLNTLATPSFQQNGKTPS